MRLSALTLIGTVTIAAAVNGQSLPLTQSDLDASAADSSYRVPLDSTVSSTWIGSTPGSYRWDLDGNWLYFTFDTSKVAATGVTPEPTWWRVSRNGQAVESVSQTDASNVPTSVNWTRDGNRATWFQRGALWVWQRGVGSREVLRRAGAVRPSWSEDESEVRWSDTGDLYGYAPASGLTRQITHTHTAKTLKKDKPESAELKKEQLEIFDFVRQNKERKDSSDVRRLRNATPAPFTVVKPKADDRISQVALSPANSFVSYLVSPKDSPVQTIWGDYVNDSGVVITKKGRAKVGETPTKTRIAIVPADGMLDPDSVSITWVIDDSTAFPKKVRALSANWNRQGTHLVAEYASLDYRDRWVVLVNPDSGTQVRTLHHEHDDDWLLESSGVTWLPDGEHIALISEATGWQHLYLIDMQGNSTALTSGNWEVRSATLSNDGNYWWLRTSERHPSEVHVYTMPVNGGVRTRIDNLGEGEASVTPAPDGKALALNWSEPTSLPNLYLMSSHQARPLQVTRSGRDNFWRIVWPKSEFVAFAATNGDSAWARVYRPSHQSTTRPAVLEIHGAGYAQGVHKTFKSSGAHGGSLYAKYLTDLGATYMVLDYQGSAGYGRDTRVAIYRTMGNRDVGSSLAAIPFLRDNYNVNPDRIGLFGCSYGGFYTLMALFKHPGTFRGGVAQCAVTDWAHYNGWYTSRILNGVPADDSIAYRESSPIYHARGLADPLILEHGLVDNNVQYQDAVRLVQRLMELGKDFEFVTYPIESHGWRTEWAKRDSQRRMQKLWERVLFN